MPFDHGATWTYAKLGQGGSQQVGTSVVTLSNTTVGTNRQLRFTRSEAGTTDMTEYVWKSDGLYATLAADSVPPGVLALIGEVREYAFPSYAAGETRTVARAGTWDEDIDGDGLHEKFSYEYNQRFEGIVPLALPWDMAATAARMTTYLRVTIRPSTGAPAFGLQSERDEYYAPGVGLVKSSEFLSDLNRFPLEAPRSYTIVSATIGSQHFAAPVVPVVPVVPSPLAIALPHASLVFDNTRNVYYASVAAAATTGSNSIATITPGTGAVTYSAALGAAPDALAVSHDGSVVYVGLRDLGQVVKLTLPAMSEVARITLGVDGANSMLYAESLAVSPSDPNVFAVSLAAAQAVPRHRGVTLIRGTTVLSTITQAQTRSNIVTFGADGSTLYGINNETTEFGLRRIDVVNDVLQQGIVVGPYGSRFGQTSLVYSYSRVYAGRYGWRAADLVRNAEFDIQAPFCVPLVSGLRAVCATDSSASAALSVWNMGDLTLQTTVSVSGLAGQIIKQLVPGRAGVMALSVGSPLSSDRILLVDEPAFQ